MSDPAVDSTHMKALLYFLNSQPWTEEERGDACASMAAAYVLYQEGRRATKTWALELTVKGQRAKVMVKVACDPDMEQIAKG